MIDTLTSLFPAGRALKDGDMVFPVAPSGPYPKERIAKARTFIERNGYRFMDSPLLDTGAYTDETSDPFRYLAFDDRQRADMFMQAFRHEGNGVVWTFRGGYGASRMLDFVGTDAILAHPKLFVGFSDVTAIHAWMLTYGLFASVHGPNLNRFAYQPQEVQQQVFSILKGEGVGEPLRLGDSLRTIRGGHVEGMMVGGNLTVLTSILGTPLMPVLDDAILLLEDVEEHPYRLDRMLWQMRQAGIFEQICGIVLGEFTPPNGINPKRLVARVEEMVYQYTDGSVPILSGASVGHGEYNFPVPLGVKTELDADATTVIPLRPWTNRE